MLAERRTWKFTLNGCDAKNLFRPQMATNCGMTEWLSFQVSTFAIPSKARLRFLAKINRVLNQFSVDSRDLQNYCEHWDSEHFDIHRLPNASGESQTTLDMYSAERTFLCPDGEYRLFEFHLKRWGTRIHFFDFPASKRILIGYVGDHLRISGQ